MKSLLLLAFLTLPALTGQSQGPEPVPNYDAPPPQARALRKGNYIVRSRITTSLSDLPLLRGRTFVVLPSDKKMSSDKAFAAFAKFLGRVLVRRGMVLQTDPAKRPDFVILMDYAKHEIDPDEAHTPVVGETIRFAKAEARLYRHVLALVVLDEGPAGGGRARLVYKGSVSSDAPSPIFAGVMPKMMNLWAKNLPGKTGETRDFEGPN